MMTDSHGTNLFNFKKPRDSKIMYSNKIPDL